MGELRRLTLNPLTTGAEVAEANLDYLKDRSVQLEAKTTLELIGAIKNASQGHSINLTERDWVRLADAALTIGAGAIDRVTRRLTIQGAALGWPTDFDFRPLATQIHALAAPARKLRNAIAHRAKCVRAILKIQIMEGLTGPGFELATQKFPTEREVIDWQVKSFAVFEECGSVNARFHSMYQKEWDEFCAEWVAFNFKDSVSIPNGLDSIFEKYVSSLFQESSKFKLRWEYQVKPELNTSAMNVTTTAPITFDFKRKQEHFTISVRVPNMKQSDFNSISIDLMDLIEVSTGLKHVDTMRGGKDQELLNVDVYGRYTMDDLKKALNAFEVYFNQKYPNGLQRNDIK